MSVINSGIIVVVVVGGCSKEERRKKEERERKKSAGTDQQTPHSDFYLHAMMRTNCNNLRDRAAVVLRNVYSQINLVVGHSGQLFCWTTTVQQVETTSSGGGFHSERESTSTQIEGVLAACVNNQTVKKLSVNENQIAPS